MGLHHSSTCAEKIELFYNIPSLESISILYKKNKKRADHYYKFSNLHFFYLILEHCEKLNMFLVILLWQLLPFKEP